MPKIRTIIRGGLLLDAEARIAEPRDILVEDGAILEIGPAGMPAPADAMVFDAARTIMHAGLVNGHTHGIGNLCKGTGERWTLELLWTSSGDMIDNQSLEYKYLNTYLGAIEMVTKGCTTAYDLTFGFPFASIEEMEAIGQAYLDAGMRCVLAPMLADFSFYEAIPGLLDALPPHLKHAHQAMAPAEVSLSMMRQSLQSWPHDKERVRLGVSPIIPLHCSDALLTGCATLAREFGAPLHSHVAESKSQAVSSFTRYGKTLTHHIDDLGLLGPDFTVAHGVWLDDDDMRRLAGNGASVSHNAGSNMRLGSGIADARRMLELGVNLAIGTDSANCADNQNMYEAMRYASMAASVRGPDFRKWLRTSEIFKAATQGGAYATGFSGIGSIAKGFKADIVFLSLDSVNWMPVNDPANQVVLTEDGTGVAHVMVDGEIIVHRGKHVKCSMSELASKVGDARTFLRAANAESYKLQAALEDVVGDFCMGLSRQPYHIERYATCSTCPPGSGFSATAE
jgi:5-methylthioadenosine/S-adenosylhomocysteine deaminase